MGVIHAGAYFRNFTVFLLFDRVNGAKLCYKPSLLEQTRGTREKKKGFLLRALPSRVVSFDSVTCYAG